MTVKASLVGRTLGGRYKIIALVGKGGMGTVYEAEQVDLARRVAIKVLGDEAGDHDSFLRFKQEALAAAGLAHPNIVQVFDFVESPEPFMVMELLRGRSLAALVREGGKLAPARAVNIMTQVLSALVAAHEARVVHRDVKPENIFVCDAPRAGTPVAKVLDFGLARPLDEVKHIARTRMGLALGTPAYMAPEQASGADADVRMDVFAAGVTLYYALAGRRPFEGKTTSEVLRAVRLQPPIPLDALCPDLDLELVRVVERSLSKDPAARFASAHDFLDALVGLREAPANLVATAPQKDNKHTTQGRKRRGRAPDPVVPRSPAIAPGMVHVARFAADGSSALAVGPSGLARWTLDGGWSARALPPGLAWESVRDIALGPAGEAVLVTPSGAHLRVGGAFTRLRLPAHFAAVRACVASATRVAFAGTLGNDAAVIEWTPAGVRGLSIARGIQMNDVALAGDGYVACGERATVCILEGDRVNAHVAGRVSLASLARTPEGFVAVGGGSLVHVPHLTSGDLAAAVEVRFVDDDLILARAHGELVCAVGRRVHVFRPRDPKLVWSHTAGIVRDAFVGPAMARVMLDSAAVLDLAIDGL